MKSPTQSQAINAKKIILITGGSQGIGREIAHACATHHATIIITHLHSKKEAKKTCDECIDAGASGAYAYPLDISKNASIRAFQKIIKKNHPQIHVLINNAGILIWKTLRKQTIKDIEQQLRVNLEGTIKITHALLPHIREQIVNIASRAGTQGHAHEYTTTYSASKFGVRGFGQALAHEEKHLRILAINPGITATPMTQGKGINPTDVANVIVKSIMNPAIPSGSDVNVWEILHQTYKKWN